MLKRRLNLGWTRTGEPRWERDIPFWTIPGTDRKLLCDVWLRQVAPPAHAALYYLERFLALMV